jgi:hypothetical protein
MDMIDYFRKRFPEFPLGEYAKHLLQGLGTPTKVRSEESAEDA